MTIKRIDLVTVLICFAVIIISVSANIVFYLFVYQMNNYPFFVAIFMPILSSIVGVLILVINHLHHQKYGQSTNGNSIDENHLLSINNDDDVDINESKSNYSVLQHTFYVTLRSAKCWKYLLSICALYSLANTFQVYLMQLLGHNDSNLTVLLSQFTIPFSMLFSYLLYKQKHSTLNIIGSLIVIIGVGVAFSSDMEFSGSNTSIIYLILYLLTCIPKSVAMVCTKHAFQIQLFNTFEFAVIENIIEIPFNFLCALMSTAINPKHDCFHDYKYGFIKMISINEKCKCYILLFLAVLFSIIALLRTYSQNLLFDRSGVILYLLISAISLPISNICLSSSFIMAQWTADSNPTIFWAFIIVPIGIFVYALGQKSNHDKEKQFDTKASIDSVHSVNASTI